MRWVAVAALAGCNWVYGLDETQLRDARAPDATPDAPGCADRAFSNPVELPAAFQDGRNFDPVFASPLELWLVRRDTTYDLFISTRESETAAFGPVAPAPVLNTSYEEISPTFSADGLVLAYVSNGDIMLASRPSLSSPFGAPAPVAALADVNGFGGGVILSYDGLALYYSDGAYNLHVVTRPDRGSPFGDPSGRIAQGVKWIGLSPDQLELYYVPINSTDTIQRMTRASTTASFDSPQAVMAGSDPDVLPDAMTLVFSDQGRIKYATRQCR